MEQNNFEKNVQQKLGELKIPPSDSVWINIEKRMEKKRGKRIIFILFFVFLFLLSGGYWLFNSTKNNTRQKNHPLSNLLEKNSKSTLPAVRQANNQDSSSGHSIVSSGAIAETTDTFQVAAGKIKTPSTTIQNAAIKRAANKKQKNVSLKAGFIAEDKIIAPSQNKKLKRGKNIDSEENNKLADQNYRQEREAVVTEAKEENSIPDQDIIAQNKVNGDTLFNTTQEKLITKKDSSVKKTSQNLQKHKWIFGVTFSGGISLLSNELLNMDKNSSDYQSAPNSGTGNIGNGSIGGGSPSRLPAKTINSTAFIAGVFIEKNISKKSQISLGINYKYFSTVNKTGNKIDSIVTAYNSSTYTNSYRNNFNYLELPVLLKFQLTDNKSLPVYWLAGINISQLINSNALQFESDPGIYYRDNSLFNKTQLGFSTGFFATLFSKQETPVNIGTYFYYNASRLANEGLYDKKHFNFIGISAEIMFNKK